MTPHKHAALIKAWADGAEIQSRRDKEDVWQDCPYPAWLVGSFYRIKPTPKPDEWHGWSSLSVSGAMLCDVEFLINGETGELMDVRMKEKNSGNV